MKFHIRYFAVVSTFLFALFAHSNAIPNQAVKQHDSWSRNLNRNDLPSLPLSQFQNKDILGPSTTELTLHESAPYDNPTPLSKRQRVPRAIQRMRWQSLFLLWANSRLYSLTDGAFGFGTNHNIEALKNLYSGIRAAALNEWARLPEQSSVRVVYGYLVFYLLPPADRTVPWSILEELAYTLLLMTAAGMGGLITGWVPVVAATTVTWFYLAVIAPVQPGSVGVGGSGGVGGGIGGGGNGGGGGDGVQSPARGVR